MSVSVDTLVVSEILITINFDNGESITFSISPSKTAEIVSTTTAPYAEAGVAQMQQMGYTPIGTYTTETGAIGWLL